MTPERTRTRRRLAALAAFAAFWAALLVTIGFPVLLVAVCWLALVLGLFGGFGGRHALAALLPRAGTAAGELASGSRAVAARVERIDWEPLRRRSARGVELVAQAGRRAASWSGRAAAVASAKAAAAGSTAAAGAGTQARTLRRELSERNSRRATRSEALRLNAQAATLRNEGAFDEALEAGERALAIIRTLQDRRAEALTLNGIGLTQAKSGDEAGAVDSYEAAIGILTELGDSHGAGRVLANLGALHLDLGDEDEARARWTDALERLEPGSPEHERTAEQLRLAG
jgi:tetratricopeptide (TPR) repeat protein